MRQIRNLAEQDELLQKIIDEIFRMANTELERPFINYEELIDRSHRTSKEALSGKWRKKPNFEKHTGATEKREERIG